MITFLEQYKFYQDKVEEALLELLPLPQEEWPDKGKPRRLVEAMRYSLLSGGKRIRPVLLLAAFHAYSEDLDAALPFAVAVEMIHTYSLIHDDLPAMDDDDLRRGKPTSHKVFGEAMAILAGDALLSEAFELMSESPLPYAQKALNTVVKRAGAGGMIAGQTADILLSGEAGDQRMVRYIHEHKTADLLTAPLVAGLILSGAPFDSIKSAEIYGHNLGLAFQITDDLLDLSGDPGQTGKLGQRDSVLGKQTWPFVVGEEQARVDVQAAVDAAVMVANAFVKNEPFFRSLAISIPERVK